VADASALDVARYRAQRLARYATVIAEARSRSLRRTKAQPRDLPRRGGEVTPQHRFILVGPHGVSLIAGVKPRGQATRLRVSTGVSTRHSHGRDRAPGAQP
jgi:hypothetical protein